MAKYIVQQILKEYGDYLKTEEATIVFIVKNLVNSLDTRKKWIDVVDIDTYESRSNKYAFNYFVVELFDRKIHPRF